MIYLGTHEQKSGKLTLFINNSNLKETSLVKFYFKYCIFEGLCNTT